jgi:hypothetical protein
VFRPSEPAAVRCDGDYGAMSVRHRIGAHIVFRLCSI